MALARTPEVTVVIVSFNTRELTLRAIETLLANAGDVSMRIVVWDNASHDGSADAIAAAFPGVELIRSTENVGFGMANNAVARMADTEWMLLLNSDTETHPAAVERLLAFAKDHPQAGLVGGRTVFPDGSLNSTSVFNRMTCWSLFCLGLGLSRVFPESPLLNPEGIGGWQRDSVREVDIVTGCFLLVRTELWHRLGGFNERYFMYGEDVDLAMRSRKIGYRPMMTPDAQIMHLGSASAVLRESKVVQLMKGKASIIRDHWSKPMIPVGIGLLWLWIALRRLGSAIAGSEASRQVFKGVWDKRADWLRGY